MNALNSVLKKRRWLGLLLSVFVPGFGIIRAGNWPRGAGWFLGLHAVGFVMGVSFALSVVPFWLAAGVFVTAVVAHIWMLWDSFRPGRMRVSLWLVFFGLFAVSACLESPAFMMARPFTIPTAAMEPTLLGSRSASTPDHVMVDRLSYRFGSPKRGDLIVFSTSRIPRIPRQSEKDEEILYIKRLVGLPGERIRIADGKVFADGRSLDEEDGIPPFYYTEFAGVPSAARPEGPEFVVGSDEYFVLGDNSLNSLDSRYWGCVPASAVYGKVTMIYYPFDRAGRVRR